MKIVAQRVSAADVSVDGEKIGSIGKGILIFVGIKNTDAVAEAEWLADKVKRLRIFEDENGKMSLSASDLNYEYLVISQFTLYGDCRKGTRPSFVEAAAPQDAEKLYEYFVQLMKKDEANVQTGRFGADMKIAAYNDGPVTIILEK